MAWLGCGRIEEKDLDKSDGTLLSLQISGVTVIGRWFLSVLPQLGGDSGPTLGDTAGEKGKVLRVWAQQGVKFHT